MKSTSPPLNRSNSQNNLTESEEKDKQKKSTQANSNAGDSAQSGDDKSKKESKQTEKAAPSLVSKPEKEKKDTGLQSTEEQKISTFAKASPKATGKTSAPASKLNLDKLKGNKFDSNQPVVSPRFTIGSTRSTAATHLPSDRSAPKSSQTNSSWPQSGLELPPLPDSPMDNNAQPSSKDSKYRGSDQTNKQTGSAPTITTTLNATVVPTTTTTTNTTTTTTTTTSTTNTSKPIASTDASSEAYNYFLPKLYDKTNRPFILGPELLGKQLIRGETWNYKKPISSSVVDTAFRGPVPLLKEKDKPKSDATENNAITAFLKPFMDHYFITPSFQQKLNEAKNEYEKKQVEISLLYQNWKNNPSHKQKFGEVDAVQKIMDPIIQPVVEHICGKGKNIETTQIAKTVLLMMLTVDEGVQEWFTKAAAIRGSDANNNSQSQDKETVKLLRENAIISFLTTRSFMPYYHLALDADLEKFNNSCPEGQQKSFDFYLPLKSYLNYFLSTQSKEFLASLMSCTPEQKKQIAKASKMEEISMSRRAALPEEEQQQLLDANKERVLSRKPTKLINIVKDALDIKPQSENDDIPVSPRRQLQRNATLESKSRTPEKETTSSSALSPRRHLLSEKTDDPESAKAKTLARKRQTVTVEYLNRLKMSQYKDFPELGDIFKKFNKHIQTASRENYQDFKKNPDASFFKFIKAYIAKQKTFGNATSLGLMQLFSDLSYRVNVPQDDPFEDSNQDE